MKLLRLLAVLCCASALGATTGKKISDYTQTLTIGDSWIYEIAVPGVTNYKVTFGTMATNILSGFNGTNIWDRSNVKFWGATGNGVTDDTAAITAAIASVTNSGGTIKFPAGTYITAGISIRANNVSILGEGSSSTKIRLKAGTDTNVFELGNTAAGNSAVPYTNITVSGLTLDGNKLNCPSNTTDLTGWGLVMTKIQYSKITDVRAVSCGYAGMGMFIDSNFNFVDAYVGLCGGNAFQSAPGFDVNSSKYNHISVTSEKCSTGVRVLDNCYGNVIDASIFWATNFGFIYNNQAVNKSQNNIISATIENGCLAGGFLVGQNCRSSKIDMTAVSLIGIGLIEVGTSDGVALTNLPSGNSYSVNTRGGLYQSVLCGGVGSVWDIISTQDGRSGPQGSYFAVDVYGTNHTFNIVIYDLSPFQVRGLNLRSNSENNTVIGLKVENAAPYYTDTGTNNLLDSLPISTKLSITAKDSIRSITDSGPAYFFGGNLNGGVDAKFSYIGMASGGFLTFGKANDALNTLTENVKFTSDGKVGIGTNDPAARLHVVSDNSSPHVARFGTTNRPDLVWIGNDGTVGIASNLWVTGAVSLGSSSGFQVQAGAGTAGQVLASADTLGNVMWTNAGSGSSVSPPISSVQFNSNGVMQGSSAFTFTNGILTVPRMDVGLINANILALTNSGRIFAQTNTVIVTNTATTSALLDGAGVTNIAANLLVVGNTIRIKLFGIYFTPGAPAGTTLTLRVLLNGSVAAQSPVVQPPGGMSGQSWDMSWDAVVRATGASGILMPGGMLTFGRGAATTSDVQGMPRTATTTIDTTAAITVSVDATFNNTTDADAIHCQGGTIEIIP